MNKVTRGGFMCTFRKAPPEGPLRPEISAAILFQMGAGISPLLYRLIIAKLKTEAKKADRPPCAQGKAPQSS